MKLIMKMFTHVYFPSRTSNGDGVNVIKMVCEHPNNYPKVTYFV